MRLFDGTGTLPIWILRLRPVDFQLVYGYHIVGVVGVDDRSLFRHVTDHLSAAK
jgi:hypothetical protein